MAANKIKILKEEIKSLSFVLMEEETFDNTAEEEISRAVEKCSFEEVLDNKIYDYLMQHKEVPEEKAIINSVCDDVCDAIEKNPCIFDVYNKLVVGVVIQEQDFIDILKVHLKDAIGKIYDDSLKRAMEDARDTISFNKNPYDYYGVKKTDF